MGDLPTSQRPDGSINQVIADVGGTSGHRRDHSGSPVDILIHPGRRDLISLGHWLRGETSPS